MRQMAFQGLLRGQSRRDNSPPPLASLGGVVPIGGEFSLFTPGIRWSPSCGPAGPGYTPDFMTPVLFLKSWSTRVTLSLIGAMVLLALTYVLTPQPGQATVDVRCNRMCTENCEADRRNDECDVIWCGDCPDNGCLLGDISVINMTCYGDWIGITVTP